MAVAVANCRERRVELNRPEDVEAGVKVRVAEGVGVVAG